MLKAIKLSLRLTGDEFDSEIVDIIEACKADLKKAGVTDVDGNDPLILRAVTLYAKGHFGFAEIGIKSLQAYESLKIVLTMTEL